MEQCGIVCHNGLPCDKKRGHNTSWKHGNIFCGMCGINPKVCGGRCRSCAVLTSAKWRKDNPERYKQHARESVVRSHKITLQERAQLLESQNHICPICSRTLIGFKINIDHFHGCLSKRNHIKGKHGNDTYGCRQCIRGILCVLCNRAILPYLEQFPHLQTEDVKEYLSRRPFNADLS